MTDATGRCMPELILDDSKRYLAAEEWEDDQASEVSAYDKRKSAGVWTALATLAVAVAIMAGYGYFVLSQEDTQLAQIPALTNSLPAVGLHLSSFEKRLDAWLGDQQNLTAQVQRMDAGWKSAFGQAREHTSKLIQEAREGLRQELDHRTLALSAQISQMAAAQRAERTRLAEVEKQLDNTRQELASARQDYSRELSALRQQQHEDHGAIASLNNLLTTNQVTFEIQKDKEEEVVPGVSVHLTNTDVRFQRFDGWIELAPARQFIWVRGQGIQRPVVFYPDQRDEAYELVVTRVNQEGAVGYLVVPAQNSAIGQGGLDSENQAAPVSVIPSGRSEVTGP